MKTLRSVFFPNTNMHSISDSVTSYHNNELIKTLRSTHPEDTKAKDIQELIKKGANINFRDSDDNNNTPLHVAIEKGELQIIQLLLENGANVEFKNRKGESPLNVAHEKSSPEIISVLEIHILKQLEEREKLFVKHFVYILENALQEYFTRLQNRSTKEGKWFDLFKNITEIMGHTTESIEVPGEKASMLVGISLLQNAISGISRAHNWKKLSMLAEVLYKYNAHPDPDGVRKNLIQSGICVFQKFESQFSQATCHGSWNRAMTKLAEDAVFRIINYCRQFTTESFSPSFITKAAILGQSKTYKHIFFDLPRFKPGHTLHECHNWNTSELLSNMGLVIRKDKSHKYYKFRNERKDASKKYGFRLPFEWELLDQELVEKKYSQVTEAKIYKYISDENRNEMLANEIFNAMKDSKPIEENLNDVESRIKKDAEKNSKKIEDIISKHHNLLLDYWKKHQEDMENHFNNLVNHFDKAEQKAEKRHNELSQKLDEIQGDVKDLKKLSTTSEVNKQLRKAKWSKVRYSVKSFTGREIQLNEIHENIQQGKIVVICGLGGAGKSELSIKYARDKYTTDKDSVVWIDAETQEIAKESFRKLAKSLDIPYTIGEGTEEKPRNIEDVVKDIYDYFTDTKSLFIFDNAERYNIEMFLPFFLRPGQSDLNVLITSRVRKWTFEAREVGIVELGQFTPKEAEEFITKSLDTADNSECIAKLGEDLQYFPLALKQATAYINSKNEDAELMGEEKFTVKDYLIEYEIAASKLLDFRCDETIWSYDKTVFTTWKISTDRINEDPQNGENAINILNIMAYLTPDRLNVRDVFSKWLPDKTQLNNTVKLLHQHSIISYYKGFANIHRLVQQVTRIYLIQKCKQIQVMTNALKLFKDNLSSDNIDNCIILWNHINSDVKLIYENVSDEYKKLIQTFSKSPSQIVNKMNDNIRYEEGHSFGSIMSRLLEHTLGDHDPDTLHLQNSIAGVLFKQGKYDEAYTKYDDVLKKRENMNNPNHNDILSTKHGKANVLYRQGKYNNALEIYKEVLEAGTDILGEDNALTLSTMHSIAVVLNNKGEYNEALDICNIIINKMSGRLDHDKLAAMHEKGRSLDNLGRYKEAKEVYKQTLKEQEEILGMNHYTTLYTMHGLGRALSNQGEYKEALDTYERLLAKRQKFGEDNPDYLATQNNIAVVYNKLGYYSQAMDLYEEVLEKRVAKLGPRHPSTLYTLHGMAKVLKNQGKYDRALEKFEAVLAIRKEVLGPNQPATLSSRHEVGVVLYNLGKCANAMKILEDVLERRKKYLSDKHPSTLSTRNAIAEVLEKTGENVEALKMFEEVYKDRRMQLGEDHPYTLTTRCGIANVLRKNGEHGKALEMFHNILNECILKLGDDHPSTLKVAKNIEEMENFGGSSSPATTISEKVVDELQEKSTKKAKIAVEA